MFPNSYTAQLARSVNNNKDRHAKPYCECWNKRAPMAWKQLNTCSCGEENDVGEWKWQKPDANGSSWVVVSEDQTQVTFHPFYSSGTAAIRGDTPLQHNYHYYWEIKILTDTYGTDIMVGVGTDKVDVSSSQFTFTSLLGSDAESYGLSYTGALRHAASVTRDGAGFCRGSLVGVRLDLWRGTLEFYINREPQGVAFFNLRRHPVLYPMMCSTAAQSSMRLTYAASWRASLLVDAVKSLAASSRQRELRVPPGLWNQLRPQFWMSLPNKGCVLEDGEEPPEPKPMRSLSSALGDVIPSQYLNGYYTDNVARDSRVVVWE